jgi:hypothetical protein
MVYRYLEVKSLAQRFCTLELQYANLHRIQILYYNLATHEYFLSAVQVFKYCYKLYVYTETKHGHIA